MSNHAGIRIDKRVALRYQSLFHDRDSEDERIVKQIKVNKYRLELWLRENNTNELSDLPCADQLYIDDEIIRIMTLLIALYKLLKPSSKAPADD